MDNIVLKCAVIVLLTVLIMYLIRKLVESVINWQTYRQAMKDPNHTGRVPNSGIVLNKKTKKLEPSGPDYKIILPFN